MYVLLFKRQPGTGPEIGPGVTGTELIIAKFTRLSTELAAGSEDDTLIRYLVPGRVPDGIVAGMVPEDVPVSVPMGTGLLKPPSESDN